MENIKENTIVNSSYTIVIEKPLKDCDLCELKIISSWELLKNYRAKFGLKGLSKVLNDTIKSALKENASHKAINSNELSDNIYTPKDTTISSKLISASGTVKITVNMDEKYLAEKQTLLYLEQMAKQIKNKLAGGDDE